MTTTPPAKRDMDDPALLSAIDNQVRDAHRLVETIFACSGKTDKEIAAMLRITDVRFKSSFRSKELTNITVGMLAKIAHVFDTTIAITEVVEPEGTEEEIIRQKLIGHSRDTVLRAYGVQAVTTNTIENNVVSPKKSWWKKIFG